MARDVATDLIKAIAQARDQLNAEAATFHGPFVLELHYKPSVTKIEVVLRPMRRLPDYRPEAQ